MPPTSWRCLCSERNNQVTTLSHLWTIYLRELWMCAPRWVAITDVTCTSVKKPKAVTSSSFQECVLRHFEWEIKKRIQAILLLVGLLYPNGRRFACEKCVNFEEGDLRPSRSQIWKFRPGWNNFRKLRSGQAILLWDETIWTRRVESLGVEKKGTQDSDGSIKEYLRRHKSATVEVEETFSSRFAGFRAHVRETDEWAFIRGRGLGAWWNKSDDKIERLRTGSFRRWRPHRIPLFF